MHELSLAQNILEIVEQNVPSQQRPLVKSIKLRLGESSGVVADSLEFCFSIITADTPMNKAFLQIERTPFMIACSVCRKSFESPMGMSQCPQCGSRETDIVGGTEMRVVEIELNDPEST